MKYLIQFLIIILTIPALAQQVLLLSQQTVAKNQGDRDYCAYYSAAALIESALKSLAQKDYDLSEDFEYLRNKKIYPWRPEVEFGDTYRVLQNIKKDGYVISEDKKTKIIFSGLDVLELTQLWVKTPWSLKVIGQIQKGHSVIATIKVSSRHVNDQTGLITFNETIDQDCQSGKIPCGGHAVLIVGYDSDKKLFAIKNSWGPGWGRQGFGVVSFEHVDKYASDFMTAYFNKLYSPVVREEAIKLFAE